MNNSQTIIPFAGTDMITFDMTYDQVRNALKESKIVFNVDFRPNKGCTPEVPWKIIRTNNSVSVFFANDKMFKINCGSSSQGILNNGIKVGMSIEDAMKTDPTLEYDEFEEYYVSSNGYWLFVDSGSDTISDITVFIKAVLDDEIFFSYKWC
ncbi:MAG: hypothetical protein IKN80_09805 [Clostridiales bacterium]|nr:hypothetical protein [Clostridiales bacterium]